MCRNHIHLFFLRFRNTPVMSFRTERSRVKNLGYIHVIENLYATEILRFALDDN